MTLSKIYIFKKNFALTLAFCAVNFFCVLASPGQELDVKIKIVSLAPSQTRVHVEGRLLNPKGELASRDWSFLQNYADVSELGVRIENFKLAGETGEKLEVKKLIPGEFQADNQAVFFEYDVKTDVPNPPASAAHVSWLTNERGLLMLNDLLPQWSSGDKQPVSAKVTIKVPFGWTITGNEAAGGENAFEVKNIEKAVFLVGKNWRGKTVRVGKTELNLALAGGDWQFSDDEAAEMAASILKEHQKIFGEIPVEKAQIFILPFPQKSNPADRWRAETRGGTVTIISGALPYKSQALQRLHEQLRHEIYHLWVPNALALSGNYDWFYEGFTIYQALRTGIEMNQIRFEDFLNTLARAYDMAQNQNASLIDISNKRWTTATSGTTVGSTGSVYAKGMIVAFLCDAALLSGGKHSLSDIFRQVYQKHRISNPTEEGNAAILRILKSYPELLPVVRDYIEGAAKLEWQDELHRFGIESVSNNSSTELKVAQKLGGRQKDLLDKLGYNQWRKLLQKTK